MVAEEGRWEGVSPWKVLLCTALEALVGASGTAGVRSTHVSGTMLPVRWRRDYRWSTGDSEMVAAWGLLAVFVFPLIHRR